MNKIVSALKFTFKIILFSIKLLLYQFFYELALYLLIINIICLFQ